MSTIVSSGYSYLTCNAPGCDIQSRHVYGENDGQRDIDQVLEKEGWQCTHNGHHYCPKHAFNRTPHTPMPHRPLCEECHDDARTSFCNELREGLKARGLWAPDVESDLLSAVFQVIDRQTTALKEIERFGHNEGHGRGYSCANIAAKGMSP